jgi:FkbM family methyltransferase
MTTIRQITDRAGDVALGQQCEFEVLQVPADTEVRVLVRSNGILYLRPLSDWTPWSGGRTIKLSLESPGTHCLVVQVRRAGRVVEVVKETFHVSAGSPPDYLPTGLTIEGETRICAPSRWESGFSAHHEEQVVRLLPELVKPGDVVFDVGANIGLFSIRFARLVPPDGHVYCVEANPVCVYFLRANMELNGLTNYDILPVAVSNAARSCEFVLNYDNLTLGLTADASFFPDKSGHKILVEACSLDELIHDYALRLPDVIKIDIEGAEAAAVSGMMSTIGVARPIVIIELHGRSAALETLRLLDRSHFRYQVSKDLRPFDSADALVDWMPEECIQVVALP